MDFLKILRSIEELLYEVMSWLVFYPLTLWRSLRHPLRMMRYSDAEQSEKAEQQYLETLSPPLFLVLSILLAYWVEIATGAPQPVAVGPEHGIGRTLLRSTQNLLAFRAVAFSIFPLMFAAASLRCAGKLLDRHTLRAPFFSQCFPAGVLAILLSLGVMLPRYDDPLRQAAGTAVSLAAVVWYVAVQWQWFRRIEGQSAGGATRVVAATFAGGLALLLLAGALVTYG
jgi:hypothetical protein